MRLLSASLIVLLWHQTARAQYPDLTSCVGTMTVATGCKSYNSILSSCNNFVGSKAASCYCPQTVLNAIAGCKGDFRMCAQGYEYDSEFDGPDGLFGLWHSACDGVLTYSPTTPVVASLSRVVDPTNCLSAESYCQRFGASTDACTTSSANDLQNCLCQATVLDLASRCEIDGSISCELLTPITTNLFSYKQCGASRRATEVTPTITSTQTVVTSQVSIAITKAQPSSTPISATSTQTKTASNFARGSFKHSQLSLSAGGLVAVLFSLF